jgi:hypothetical protein
VLPGKDGCVLRSVDKRQPGGPANEANFRRGLASLHVSTSTDGVLLSIDYQAFARRGH